MRLALLTFYSLFVHSCAAPTGSLPRFHEVDHGKVYRSAQPNGIGYAEMAKAGIRTVVKLNTDQADQERAWAASSGIRLIEVPLPGLTAPSAAAEDHVQALIRDPANQPVLFHCEQGEDRTGLVAAIYRVEAQGWAPAAAHKEFRDLGHSPLLHGMDEFFEKREGEDRSISQ